MATRNLLDGRRFDEISVADILAAAGVARGSFYFYFEGKHAVLAELVSRAVGEGHRSAVPWLDREAAEDPRPSVRHGISDGARLWRTEAPVLRAIVENWRSDPKLTSLWLELMNSYTVNVTARIEQDRRTGIARPSSVSPAVVAATLTWAGERLYYLAATGTPPFNDEETLVEVLTDLWMAMLYAPNEQDPRR